MMKGRHFKIVAMNLFQTLMRPDKEELEHGERVLIAKAANILQVGEFQLLQLAYRDWHNKDLPEALVSQLFSSYMLKNEVPHWARHYARKILDAEEKGALNDNEPSFHDYDHDYHTSVPNGKRNFWIAVAILTTVLGGAIALSDLAVVRAAGMFPPYLDQEDLKPQRPEAPYGRADSLPDMGGTVGISDEEDDKHWQGYKLPTGMLPAPP